VPNTVLLAGFGTGLLTGGGSFEAGPGLVGGEPPMTVLAAAAGARGDAGASSP
jgi:hypothetical protein